MFRHTTTDMSRGWQFCLGGEWKENEVQTVCFPHPVTVTPAISSGGRNYQGKCIYRKSLFVPKEYEGKKIILEFEGLMGVSSLSVNGRVVKEHFCGYTPFVIDLSKELLRSSRLSVAQIAKKVGYNDTSHFIRLFKRFEGVTPTVYRQYNYK